MALRRLVWGTAIAIGVLALIWALPDSPRSSSISGDAAPHGPSSGAATTPKASPRRQVAMLERSTTDRPDEQTGPQIHAIYVVPADKPDRQLDVNGTIASYIADIQDWVAAPGRGDGQDLRVDTFRGQPDISFMRSAHPNPTPAGAASAVQLRNELTAAGFLAVPGKVVLVFFDGAFDACGYGGGRIGYVGLATCPKITTTSVHEFAHATGAVPLNAPNSDGSGHSTDPTDLMTSSGSFPEAKIDPGHDDYWHLVEPYFVASHFPIQITVEGWDEGAVRYDRPPNAYFPDYDPNRSCQGQCSPWFRKGEVLNLTVGAHSLEYRFAGWEGACTGLGDCRVTIGPGVAVTARFETVPQEPEPELEPGTVRMKVRVQGKGTVRVAGARSCSRACAYELFPEERVSMRAVAKKGSKFVKWRGSCVNRPKAKPKPRCSLTMPESRNPSLTAVFAKTKPAKR
jgi:Divergent InlB B-repeat domain